MVQTHSGITWFEDDDAIAFKSPVVSKWKVTRKIAEHEKCVYENEVQASMMESSCRGVFVCSSLDRPGEEAAVKIRMQRPHKRAEQARPKVRRITQKEVEGLQYLTTAGCSSAPALFAWKPEIQGLNAAPLYCQTDREERDELREALKRAWLYIVDWEDWVESTHEDVWEYFRVGLTP
ncbi:hypothetical protein UA08_01826 [Talaromyces atroroseus]|uniref:Uncharacterized protein n=1 Tax=Talaromyces atroroseus TaxID=1441469 RepID=A0A1Q5QBT5_TALAT|nr:hypothetical protein UA08_01826 [Talaromyces atroroseus]OKL63394.1 hypothetical protein UA08_01826 [Talaromyces atroroseus]